MHGGDSVVAQRHDDHGSMRAQHKRERSVTVQHTTALQQTARKTYGLPISRATLACCRQRQAYRDDWANVLTAQTKVFAHFAVTGAINGIRLTAISNWRSSDRPQTW